LDFPASAVETEGCFHLPFPGRPEWEFFRVRPDDFQKLGFFPDDIGQIWKLIAK
jgi:hypothetical protein